MKSCDSSKLTSVDLLLTFTQSCAMNGLLQGKRGIIFGALNEHSIAWQNNVVA
jgi:hypothetical protein